MKQGKSEVICIIDRSASMMSIATEAISAFNTFIEDQKKLPGECLLTYTQFNTCYEIIHSGIDIQDMKPLNNSTYLPSGMTALLDAVGRTVDEVGDRLNKTPEDQKPEQVILVILTDGEENASREYTWDQVSKMLKHQTEKYNWKVIFLAQGIDSSKAGVRMGLNASLPNIFVCNIGNGGSGWMRGVAGASYAVSSYRTSGGLDKGTTESIVSGDSSESLSSPPKQSKATGRGIARAQAAKEEQKKKGRRNRRGIS